MFNKITNRFKQGIFLNIEKVSIKELPFSFAQISDLHFDKTGKLDTWITKSVINYFHNNPTDILCVTGDLIDGTDKESVKHSLDFLISIPVNYVVISFGNHDEKYIDEFYNVIRSDLFKYSKLKPYINGNFKHNGINFICLADLNSKYYKYSFSDINSKIDTFLFNVVLAHNPETFKDLKDYKFPLVISGHTHGGQIFKADILRNIFKRFITKGKVLNTLRINHEHDCFKLQGSHHWQSSTLHINIGLGTHPPGRLLCPPTITVYTTNA